MIHQIVFDGVTSNWNNALPLGNGKMGAMVFYKDNTVHIALNHYDCYYPILPRYAKKSSKPAAPEKTYKELCELAIEAREDEDFSRTQYSETLNPAKTGRRPTYRGNSYPMAGEILIRLNKALTTQKFSLRLLIEKGMIIFSAKASGAEVNLRIWVSKAADVLFIRMKQSHPGLLHSAELVTPSGRGLGGYITNKGYDGSSCWQRMSFRSESELVKEHFYVSESALGIVYGCAAEHTDYGYVLSDSGKEILLASSVLPGEGAAINKIRSLSGAYKRYEDEHLSAWKKFWRCTVQLPDFFMETLWHLHLYLIECASGAGSAYPEQACGLNGLWDIRRPSLWGSMWYWDVNIEEAFWPVFSSNHLELAELFCKGYMKYEEDAIKFAKDVYGADGWALDYPHALYNCIQPWCAQFLWQYYRYSGDLGFLEDVAYRVFLNQIAFFKQIARKDRCGVLHIDPDISPEQGPVTKDSVITIASVKMLLRSAIKAADILRRPACEKEELERLLNALPDYKKTADGSRWKDSALATDDLFLRHPSVLMPIFPAEEVTKNSSEDARITALNTLKYVSEHTETGVFGFGWIACAAAKMGEGTSALRILYEEGLDHILHSNGMGYEESERFINYCLVTKPPIYPPAMTEPSGGIVAAINIMLLQTDEYIEVFPAIPGGHDGLRGKRAQYKHLDDCINGTYPAWDNCKFTGMLAPGGFEVSAERIAGKTRWIHVTSKRKEKLCLLLPAELNHSGLQEVYEKNMEPGETVCFGSPEANQKKVPPFVQIRQAAFTHRRVFLGEDRHTQFYKAVDSFTCAYCLGNSYQYQMTPYVFDFGCAPDMKNYDNVYHKEFYMHSRSLLFFGGPIRLGALAFCEDIGYGFASSEGLAVKDRNAPDDIRRDFVEGRQDNELWIELPRGKYNALIISGDEEEESFTRLTLPDTCAVIPGEIMAAGRYQCRIIPFVHERDGLFKLGLSTEKGYNWKLNAVFLNKEYAY